MAQLVDETNSKIINTGQEKALRITFKALSISFRVVMGAIKKYQADHRNIKDYHGEMNIKKLIQKEGQM